MMLPMREDLHSTVYTRYRVSVCLMYLIAQAQLACLNSVYQFAKILLPLGKLNFVPASTQFAEGRKTELTANRAPSASVCQFTAVCQRPVN